jgi:hypothetical protein
MLLRSETILKHRHRIHRPVITFGQERHKSLELLRRAVWYMFTDVSNVPPGSETSANFYQITRPNNPENRHLHTCHRENLKSHKRL